MVRMRRKHAIYLSMSDYENWCLERMATDDNLKKTEVARELIRAEAKRRGLDAEYRDADE
jgi:hypothetical protein